MTLNQTLIAERDDIISLQQSYFKDIVLVREREYATIWLKTMFWEYFELIFLTELSATYWTDEISDWIWIIYFHIWIICYHIDRFNHAYVSSPSNTHVFCRHLKELEIFSQLTNVSIFQIHIIHYWWTENGANTWKMRPLKKQISQIPTFVFIWNRHQSLSVNCNNFQAGQP